ncbi:MAG TPA: aspartate transaminase [Candidatus Ruania gallistercoris]|uniref:Aminotransferase n=1 Tax=Candidatus Ruania gallistercoris TaxID=2838746 RepID=A0A9D2EIS0_9MICO|nr:aspartate transaminase [Candidatus Ruania gallistercoris]
MAIHLADRVTRIKESPSTAATQRVRDLRAEGVEVLSLTVGEPDFDTPDFVKAAAEEAIRSGETKYTSVNGTPALQQAILDRVETRIGLRYSPAELAVGGGGKQVIFLALMATVSEGAEVIIPAPYWVSYPDMVAANHGTPVVVQTREEDRFTLTAEALAEAITPRTSWLILNSPGNPTGAVYSRAELEALAAVLREHPQVNVLTDEIYDEICFQAEPVQSLLLVAPDLRDRVLLVNGVSKTYAMTGWRIGYGVGPQQLVKAMNKLQSQVSTCASSISQAAAAAALTGDQSFIAEMTETYRRRRDLVVAGINAIPGLSCTTPDGAFYVYVNCEQVLGRTTSDGRVLDSDEALTLYLLDEARVAVVHGAAFGQSPYFRISFATSDEVLHSALDQIRAALAALR